MLDPNLLEGGVKMFASAIQNLSQMAIQESGISIPQTTNEFLLEDMKTRLDQLTPLTEEEMILTAEMIPVKVSNRLNKYLIEADDLSKFMITNRITNVKEAVGAILEASGLAGEYHNVAIVIDENSILDEMDNLGYVVSDFNLQTPPKGLGLAMVGHQKDFAKIRNIANTKELMDLVTGRYGLPLVKRNYKAVGLLNGTVHHEAVEDAQLQVKDAKNAQVLHEEDPEKKNKKDITNESVEFDEYDNGEENIEESFLHPSLSERLGSAIRKLRGKSTFKDKMGYALDNGIKQANQQYSGADKRKQWAKSFGKLGLMLGTSAAAGALGHKLLSSRKPENQNTNNVKQTKNIKAANESTDPHQNHLEYLKAVAQGKYNDYD